MARWLRAGVTALGPVRAAIDRLRSRAARPPVDLRDGRDAYTLVVDLPGVEPANVEVTVAGRAVEVRAETAATHERVEGGYLIRERRTGVLTRRVVLPGPVDPEATTAHIEAGRLTVRLPKVAPEPARRIPIRVGTAAAVRSGDGSAEAA